MTAHRKARRSQSPRRTQSPGPALPWWVAGTLVALLVVASLWGSRNHLSPVAGFGLITDQGMVRPAGTLSEIAEGQLAPDFRLLSTDHQAITLSAERGVPVVLVFWNTWCLDCQTVMPVAQQAHTEWGTDVTVIGVVPEESASRVRDGMDAHDLTMPTLLDTTGDVTVAYGARVGPVAVVLDANGTVVTVLDGPFTFDELSAAVDAAR